MDLPVVEIIELVAGADDGGSQDHGDRSDDDVRAGTDELKIESVRAAVADELDVEGRGLAGSDPGERSGVVHDPDARIGGAHGEVHRDRRDGVLDRRGDPAGDRRPESGRDLEVERITRVDRIDRPVGDRGRRSIDRPGQLREGLEPLARGRERLGIRPQADDEGTEGVEAGDRLLETGTGVERRGGPRRPCQIGDRQRHATRPGDRRLPLRLVREADVGRGEDDRQGTGTEATAADVAVRSEDVVGGVGDE